MRVLHAVTLVTPDGAYGGPVTVALNQAQALRARGHEVTLAGGYCGYDVAPVSQQHTPLVLRRARAVVPRVGFAGYAAPGLHRWAQRELGGFDLVHLHLARDLVMVPFAMQVLRRRVPYVVQPHGMLATRSDFVGRTFDRLAVQRILRSAEQVFYLTEPEREDLEEISQGGARLNELTNGAPLYEAGAGGNDVPEIIFLGRLHARKRPMDLVEAALVLNAEGATANFTLVGPDEGEADRIVRAAAAAPNVRWEGPCPGGTAPDRLRRGDIFVLPSVNEPYPMAVLEAMSVGLPVVVTVQCGLAPLIRRYGCGLVIEPGADQVAKALRELLADPQRARDMGSRGRNAIERDLGMDAIAQQLEDRYSSAALTGGRR